MQDYQVNLNLDDEAWSMPQKHFHEYYEIILTLQGTSHFFVGKQLLHVTPGTLLIIAPATIHHSTAVGEGSYVRYVLHISPQYIARLGSSQTDLLHCLSGPQFVQLADDHVAGLSRLLDICRFDDTRFGADLRRQSALLEFLLQIGELTATAPPPKMETNRSFERVIPILQYIEKNLAGDLSLTTLSSVFFISRQHLCRIFKAETGFSVKEYVSRVRILHACTLLRSGSSVQEAGEASGFSNNTHFIRMFGQIMGQSPGRYAREYRDASRI